MDSLVDACQKCQTMWYFSRFLPCHRAASDRTHLTNFFCYSSGNIFVYWSYFNVCHRPKADLRISNLRMRIALKKIDFPRFFERIRGITLPVDGVMHAFGYDEVFELDLNNSSLEVLDADPYVFADAHADFLGVSDHDPLLVVGTSKLSYLFDPTKDSQVVQLISHRRQHDIEFQTLSGDWFIASLTSDEEYLVIAEPYLLEVYRLAD